MQNPGEEDPCYFTHTHEEHVDKGRSCQLCRTDRGQPVGDVRGHEKIEELEEGGVGVSFTLFCEGVFSTVIPHHAYLEGGLSASLSLLLQLSLFLFSCDFSCFLLDKDVSFVEPYS